MELNEEGEHVKRAPVLVEHDAVLESVVALHVEHLQLSVYSPQ